MSRRSLFAQVLLSGSVLALVAFLPTLTSALETHVRVPTVPKSAVNGNTSHGPSESQSFSFSKSTYDYLPQGGGINNTSSSYDLGLGAPPGGGAGKPYTRSIGSTRRIHIGQ